MNKSICSVFLDTTVFKAADDSRLVYIPRKKKLDWGDKEIEVTVHDQVIENQNVKYLDQGNDSAFMNRWFNRIIARFAVDGNISLATSDEVMFEAMGVPRVDMSFFGAPLQTVNSPIAHSGLQLDGFGTDYLYEAIRKISHTRFDELKKLSGAHGMEGRKRHRNQLLDAFHIWSAEMSGADYFLTHDTKLQKQWNSSKYKGSCRVLDTQELLSALLTRRLRLSWKVLHELWRIKRSGRDLLSRYQHVDEVSDRDG